MKRQIIHIDEEKCNGCGLCANACHEGALAIVDGKAKLMRDDYCDGMGDCLPACPVGAISFTEREAAEYDEEAVKLHLEARAAAADERLKAAVSRIMDAEPAYEEPAEEESQLRQWPCQIKLVPVKAPYFNGADLLIAADCTAYAYPRFHQDFMRGRVTINGCPKLDAVDYSEKLSAILRENDIKSVTLTRMEVPCCGGLELAVKKALQLSGKLIPLNVVTFTVKGKIKG